MVRGSTTASSSASRSRRAASQFLRRCSRRGSVDELRRLPRDLWASSVASCRSCYPPGRLLDGQVDLRSVDIYWRRSVPHGIICPCRASASCVSAGYGLCVRKASGAPFWVKFGTSVLPGLACRLVCLSVGVSCRGIGHACRLVCLSVGVSGCVFGRRRMRPISCACSEKCRSRCADRGRQTSLEAAGESLLPSFAGTFPLGQDGVHSMSFAFFEVRSPALSDATQPDFVAGLAPDVRESKACEVDVPPPT